MPILTIFFTSCLFFVRLFFSQKGQGSNPFVSKSETMQSLKDFFTDVNFQPNHHSEISTIGQQRKARSVAEILWRKQSSFNLSKGSDSLGRITRITTNECSSRRRSSGELARYRRQLLVDDETSFEDPGMESDEGTAKISSRAEHSFHRFL
eukprot:Sdes_comp20287_c0_seq1m13871